MQTYPRPEYPYNLIEISETQVLKNTKLLMELHPQIKIAPVLKSNAYGHGIDQIGVLLDTLNLPFYCVNSLFEANMLRESGVKTDILIMGYVSPEDLEKKDYDFIFVVFDLEQARSIARLQKNPRVHLNIETGLHREGLDIFRFTELLTEIKKLTNLTVDGMMSHLACSNDPSCPTTTMQKENFKKAKDLLISNGFKPTWFHLGGSLALMNELSPDCNVVRCGKALFGIALNSAYQASATATPVPNKNTAGFMPVLKLTTRLAQVKQIKAGDHVGYADAFIAEKDMTIGILPIGYYDGIDRRLSNKGLVKINDTYCQILGMVAMNVTTIDISEVVNPHIGDSVLIYSDNPADQNSLDNTAKLAGTLPQDLLLHLAPSLTRKLV